MAARGRCALELTPLLEARGLVRSYTGREVVNIDRLALSFGEILCVLGPNGAGKSTLMRLLLLLERPDAGTILLDGRPVRAGDTAAMRRMATVFQRPFLFSGSVAANVAYGLRARGVDRRKVRDEVRSALEAVGLAARSEENVATLSGGEAQRVALARALAVRPDLIALDEPTANLDVGIRRRFREDLERLVRRGARAALLITHDPADAFALADRIAVMHDGRIVQTGTPEEVAVQPATPFVAEFTGAELLLDGVATTMEEDLLGVELAGGTRLWCAASEPVSQGQRVHVAYRPEDVVLEPVDEAGETSAINRFVLTVTVTSPASGFVRVRLDGAVALAALITRRSAERLDVRPGVRMAARIKASAVRAFAAE